MMTLRHLRRLTDLVLVLATWGVVLSVRVKETPAPAPTPAPAADAAAREPGAQYTIVPADAPDAERKPGDPADVDVIVDEAGHRAPLATPRGNGNGEYEFSPDEHWLYGNYHVGSGMAAGELFAHGKGTHFTPVGKGKEFSDLAWDFCVRQGGISADVLPPEGSDARIIDFGAWSPDSARLLVSLRGGERHGKLGVYAWHLYWNTHTGAFELTDYLRALNKDAARRWRDDNLRFVFPPAVCAEPLPDGWPAASEFEKQYRTADQELNSCYARYIAKLPAARLKDQRNAQRAWIKHRDEGAITYSKLGTDNSDKEARHWQYLAAATQKRTRELQEETPSDNAAASGSKAKAPAVDDFLPPAPVITAEYLNDDNRLFAHSPNSRFAFRKFTLPNDEDPSQLGESWLDLVASETGKTVQSKVAVKDEEDTRFGIDIVWSPDSRRFALGICPTRLTAYLKVFKLEGDTFQEITLPDFPPVEIPAKYEKKGYYPHISQNNYSHPVRWSKDGSLVAEISTSVDGNGMVTATRTFVLALGDHSDKARIASSKLSVKVVRE